jgi:Putative zinc-finger
MAATHCQDYSAHFTAFLHRELPAPDAEQLERHISGCEQCRAEIDRLHGVTRHLRKQVLTEPSAKTRQQLQQRMEQALKPPPRNAATASEPRRQQQPEGWHFVTSEPQALPITPALPALPAPPSATLLSLAAASQAQPPVAPNSSAPLARLENVPSRISARMTAESARHSQQRERLGVLMCVILALVTTLAGVAAWRLLSHSPRQKTLSHDEVAALQQKQERIRARDLGRLKEVFLSKQLQLPFEATGALYVLPRPSGNTEEVHLVLYREEDVEKIQKESATDVAAFTKALERADRLPVIDGSITLPPRLKDGSDLGAYLGRTQRVSFLIFDRRIELWPSTRLKDYLEHGVK